MILAKLSRYLVKILFLVGTDKRKLLFLLPLYLVSSVVDLLGIGLLVALISTLKGPDTLLQVAGGIPVLGQYFSSRSIDMLIVVLACVVFIVYAAKTWISIYINKLTLKITFMYGARLRSFLMGVYQELNYAMFIKRNSAEYVYNIQTMAGQFVTYTVQPVLRILSDGLVAFLIIVYLAIQDTFVLALLLVLLSVTGALYDRAYRKKISTYGSMENRISAGMIKSITEGINGYKESHIFGIVGFFRKAVSDSAFQLASSRIRSQLITTSSRYLLELIVVISVVLVIIMAIASGRDKGELLSTLALFLVASMRLVPAANQIVLNIGKLRYGRHSVEVLYSDIRDAGHDVGVDLDASLDARSSVQDIGHDTADFGCLELRDVSFRYTPEGPWVLDSVDLRIERHDIVGIVGASGSGKTTMIAVILGLLSPEKGMVSFDGKCLADAVHVKEWHRKIAYLPQEVFLIDDSIARNVALGVDEDKIDREKLRCALIKAKLDELVEGMPNGVNSPVGEKGAWISGGQRQRLALARAFYYDAEVLILDESTSALDADTADEIINELRHLKSKVTIIVITHQDALLTLCNKVFRLDSGNLVCGRH